MRTPFALVTEGPTDQEVIVNILYGFYKTKDIFSSILQPSRGINAEEQTPGGWTHLLAFLESQRFRDAFSTNEYIIVHFDTDVCDEALFGVEKHSNIVNLVEAVIRRLISSIGEDFYQSVQNRIIFAICVDSVECWLLPIYFGNIVGKRNKQTGCLSTLNEVLESNHGFYIDEKKIEYYRVMSKKYSKNSDLTRAAKVNVSLKMFLDLLPDFSNLPKDEE